MTRPALATGLTGLLAAVLLLVLAAPGAAQERGPQVVVVGIAGLRWSDVGPATPSLQRLAERGATGVLSVKALPAVSCPADGWLTLGAGARAGAFPLGPRTCPDALPTDVADQVRRNAGTLDGARVGALRTALGDRIGAEGDGARLALGLPSGDVPTADGADVRLVDLGTLAAGDGEQALRRLDARLGVELDRLPAQADVLVVGLSARPSTGTATLGVAVAAGPRFAPGALRSASTRRAPYVQLVDVAPTVLHLLGEPVPAAMDGQPWRAEGDRPAVDRLVDLDERAVTAKRVTVPFYVVLVGGLLVLLVALRRRPAAARSVALGGTAALGASYVAQLVPWWRTPAPLLVLLALVVVVAAAAAGATRSVRGVCGLTVAVLVVDLLLGGPLQVDAVAGYSPLVAGRFAGLGNVAFGVYGTAWLLLTAGLARGRSARARAVLVVVLGLVAVAVVGAPPWGSDVGGVLALVPAFTVLGLLLTGARVSVLRLAAAGLAGAAVVTGFALLDLARPAADRTHVGRFAARVGDGEAGEVLERKASAVFGLLLSSPVTALLPVVVAGAVALVLRPPPPLRRAFDEVPELRHALTAVGVLSAVGFLVNDSGAAVPALALLVAAPATLAVVAAHADTPAAPDRGTGRPVG